MTNVLTPAQVASYERDGILFPISVLAPDEAEVLRGHCDELERALGGQPKSTDVAQMHLNFRWAYDLVTNPRILDAVEDVLGPNLIVWGTSIFAKRPHDPGFISWHQDGTYWGLDSTQITTAWIALSNSCVENGCMRVVAGSQRRDILPHHETYAADNLLSRGQEIQVEVAEEDATDVVLAPGEMSLHHVRIIHGSKANQSDEKRVGFVIRYVTPEVQQVGLKPKGVLARGTDTGGHYELVGPPPERSYSEAVAAHQEAARRMYESVMGGAKGADGES